MPVRPPAGDAKEANGKERETNGDDEVSASGVDSDENADSEEEGR